MPAGVTRKWRPSLGLVLGGALAFTLAAPPAGVLLTDWLTGSLGFRNAALLVTALVVLGTAVLGYLLWRLILGPVTALTERAEALGRGDREALVEPLPHYGTREMGELGARALERIDRAYEQALARAVAQAIDAGELLPQTPGEDIVRILRVTILSCAPITQDSGSFAEVERLFAALQRLILAAWGMGPAEA